MNTEMYLVVVSQINFTFVTIRVKPTKPTTKTNKSLSSVYCMFIVSAVD